MFIKSINLQNFQKHEDLTIDFVNGVNILCGSSDVGKSCVRRAIEWCLFNENIDGIRKVGTKQTSVRITLHNDIIIERVRSQSINRIILRKNGIGQVFDSIGKTLPDEIINEIGIYPLEVDGEQIYLNSQPQIGLPFLFDKSPSFRAKLFNKLTGNDKLDELFSEFNKDILRIKRTLKEETVKFEEREIQLLSCKKELEKTEIVYERLKKRITVLKETYKRYSKLLEIKDLEEKIKSNIQETQYLISQIKIPEVQDYQQLREKIEKFTALKLLTNALEKTQIGLQKVGTALKEYSLPTLNGEELAHKINRFDTLKSLYIRLDKNKSLCYTVAEDMSRIINDKTKYDSEYKSILKDVKICPYCQTEITENHLKEIHL